MTTKKTILLCISTSLITIIVMSSLLFGILHGTVLRAQQGQSVPNFISYQGRLTNAAGQPLTDGNYSIEFRLFPVSAGGMPYFAETQNVALSGGLFSVKLGSEVPLNAGDVISPAYLEVVVEGELMTPRQQLTSVPFAFHADNASRLGGLAAEDYAPSSHNHNWTSMSGVPAGFSDGVDDNSGGDITAVTASSGLTGGGSSGDVTLALATNYTDGSAYDSRFLKRSGDTYSGNLTVNGEVYANKVTYSVPHTHYYSISAAAFSPDTNVDYTVRSGDGGIHINSGAGGMNAAVHLPDGAIITEFKFYFYDNSPYDMTATLYEDYIDTSGYSDIAEVTSSGVSGESEATDSTVQGPIYNIFKGHRVHVWSNSWSHDLRIQGVMITYTISKAP